MPDRPRPPTHAQRWRLTCRRGPDAPDLAQRELQAQWSECMARALPPEEGSDPPKVVAAAPIPFGLTSDGELVDVYVTQRLPVAEARQRLAGALPAGYELADVHDVWLGEPPLPGQVEAADYCIDLETAEQSLTLPALDEGIRALLSATMVDRTKSRPDGSAAGNLRPLIVDVRRIGPARLWMRLRFDPVLGTGRPDEVVAAIGRSVGSELIIVRRHRERLWLRGELG